MANQNNNNNNRYYRTLPVPSLRLIETSDVGTYEQQGYYGVTTTDENDGIDDTFFIDPCFKPYVSEFDASHSFHLSLTGFCSDDFLQYSIAIRLIEENLSIATYDAGFYCDENKHFFRRFIVTQLRYVYELFKNAQYHSNGETPSVHSPFGSKDTTCVICQKNLEVRSFSGVRDINLYSPGFSFWFCVCGTVENRHIHCASCQLARFKTEMFRAVDCCMCRRPLILVYHDDNKRSHWGDFLEISSSNAAQNKVKCYPLPESLKHLIYYYCQISYLEYRRKTDEDAHAIKIQECANAYIIALKSIKNEQELTKQKSSTIQMLRLTYSSSELKYRNLLEHSIKQAKLITCYQKKIMEMKKKECVLLEKDFEVSIDCLASSVKTIEEENSTL